MTVLIVVDGGSVSLASMVGRSQQSMGAAKPPRLIFAAQGCTSADSANQRSGNTCSINCVGNEAVQYINKMQSCFQFNTLEYLIPVCILLNSVTRQLWLK